jgi:hypothetical protein
MVVVNCVESYENSLLVKRDELPPRIFIVTGVRKVSTEDHRTTSFLFLIQDEMTVANFSLYSSNASMVGPSSRCGGDFDDPDLCLIEMEGACSGSQMADARDHAMTCMTRDLSGRAATEEQAPPALYAPKPGHRR